jgi:3-hydroxyisobutyrate dehydrogenase
MSDRQELDVGFVGLGVMGYPMVGHLVDGGHHVVVHDLDEAARRRTADAYAEVEVAPTAGAVGSDAEIVVTMLPDGAAVQAVALCAGGLAETMGPGSLLVDTSSSQPWLTVETGRRLAERGVAMVDAPVSGAQWGAEAAELVFMVGGEAAEIERVRPVLELMGRSVHHVGPLGSGHIMKTINNTITAMTFLATAEGLVLGKKAGLDPVAMTAVLNESTGGSWITANHIGARILSRTFDDPFKLDLMVKDVGIAGQLARGLGLPLPYAALAEALYRAAQGQAGEGASVSELVRWVERLADVEITPGSSAVPDQGATAGDR